VDDPLGVRADFPAVREALYLNSAYITPVPTSVVAAGRDFIERKSTRPISLGEMLARTDVVRGQSPGSSTPRATRSASSLPPAKGRTSSPMRST
jgi:hypothetical protein